MQFISDVFGISCNFGKNLSHSNEDSRRDTNNDDADDDYFFDIFDTITKTVRTKLSWWMFKVTQYQRRRQSETYLHERRRNMYDCASYNTYIYANAYGNNITNNRDEKSASGITNLRNKLNPESGQHGRSTGFSGSYVTITSANFRGSCGLRDNRKYVANDLPKGCSRGSDNMTHLERVTKNDVEEMVATKLAARRKEIAGMTSSQRIAHFRKKYGLGDSTKGCPTEK